MTVLPAPADLVGTGIGSGRVALRWTYPLDPAAHEIAFDVYAGTDPLAPLRRLVAAGQHATGVEVEGLPAGTTYLTVLARRGQQLSLPSGVVAVAAAEPLSTVTLAPAGSGGEPVGLGFPFAIDAAGRVRADRGDVLLRAKVLQLLLTAPGERVGEPEFGTRLRDLVFDPANDVLAAATEFAVTQGLRRFLGDLLVVGEVRVRAEDAELVVDVTYLRSADLSAQRLSVGIPIPS